MKILIFEDEWPTIRGSFEMANIYAFDGNLEFEVKTRSQDVDFNNWIDKYSLVFIDITLAKNTILDGFNIIKLIHDNNLIDLDKIIILTGNSKIEEKLIDMNIDSSTFKIVYKPLDFIELAKVIEEKLS